MAVGVFGNIVLLPLMEEILQSHSIQGLIHLRWCRISAFLRCSCPGLGCENPCRMTLHLEYLLVIPKNKRAVSTIAYCFLGKLHPIHKTRNTIGLKPWTNHCIGKYLAIPKKMWSALYLASYILPRRCFFQNFNSIQIFGDFPLNATNPSSSIFAMNNSPACIFILSCTIPTQNLCKTHHKSAPGPVEWSAPIRNQATFAATPGIPKSTLNGGCRDFTLDPSHWFHSGFLWRLFFGGSLQKKEWIIRAHCRLGFWTPPKIYIFFFQSQCILDDFQILALNLIGTWNSRWTKYIIHQK